MFLKNLLLFSSKSALHCLLNTNETGLLVFLPSQVARCSALTLPDGARHCQDSRAGRASLPGVRASFHHSCAGLPRTWLRQLRGFLHCSSSAYKFCCMCSFSSTQLLWYGHITRKFCLFGTSGAFLHPVNHKPHSLQ